MKIVLLGSAYPFRGGLANYNERLIRELQQEGHDASIYTFTLQYPSFLFPGKSQFSSDPEPRDLHIFRKVNSVNPFNWMIVGNDLKRLKPDLLLIKFWLPFMGPCFGTIARIARSNKFTRIISILDNVIPHEKRAGDKAFTSYFLNSCDGFISMSDTVTRDLQQFNTGKPVVFNPHPLYDNFGAPVPKMQAKKQLNLDPDKHYLLFFGFIRKYKGLELLLRAFADERLRKYGLKLIVAGEFYEDSKPYFELIKELNLLEEVILKADFIPDTEVSLYFSAADILVQPYLHATQSGVTQIGYQFDKPMIVTNVGGLPELVPDGKVGYVVKPEASDISEAIIDFYDNNRASFFEGNMAVEKRKFTWQQMVITILNLYHTILAGHTSNNRN